MKIKPVNVSEQAFELRNLVRSNVFPYFIDREVRPFIALVANVVR